MTIPRVVVTIGRRWICVLALSAVGVVCLQIALPWALERLQSFHRIPSTNPLAIRVALWLIVVLVGYLASGVTPVRLGHLRSAFRYPPLWIAAPLSAVLAGIAHHFSWLRFSANVVTVLWPGKIVLATFAVVAGMLVRAVVWALPTTAKSKTGRPSRQCSTPT